LNWRIYLLLRLQPERDQAADGFWSAWQVRVLPAPIVNFSNGLRRPALSNLETLAGGGAPPLISGNFFYC
jgi:hypothetical protein